MGLVLEWVKEILRLRTGRCLFKLSAWVRAQDDKEAGVMVDVTIREGRLTCHAPSEVRGTSAARDLLIPELTALLFCSRISSYHTEEVLCLY